MYVTNEKKKKVGWYLNLKNNLLVMKNNKIISSKLIQRKRERKQVNEGSGAARTVIISMQIK